MEDLSTLKEKAQMDTPLKAILVEYVGGKVNPENQEVTLEHILDVMANEFPEFVLMIAEENYLRGYEQALDDISTIRDKYGQQATVHRKEQIQNEASS